MPPVPPLNWNGFTVVSMRQLKFFGQAFFKHDFRILYRQLSQTSPCSIDSLRLSLATLRSQNTALRLV